jgi:hypothetical protein
VPGAGILLDSRQGEEVGVGGQAPDPGQGRDAALSLTDLRLLRPGVHGGEPAVTPGPELERRGAPADTYLLTLSGIQENPGPWHLRITNNDAATLRFACVSSYREEETSQPWMALENAQAARDGILVLHGESPGAAVTVRNWGTAPLAVHDPPGARLGSGRSPLVLRQRPAPIAPHDTGELVVACDEVSFSDRFSHTFDTNDLNAAHATLLFEVLPRSAGYGSPDAPPAYCRACGRCPDYGPPPWDVGGPCETCGHRGAQHFDLPPDHRNV